MVLRSLEIEDTTWICVRVNNINIARIISRIPHPYDINVAYEFIGVQATNQKAGYNHDFAVVARDLLALSVWRTPRAVPPSSDIDWASPFGIRAMPAKLSRSCFVSASKHLIFLGF
jgi:hypothetical protein